MYFAQCVCIFSVLSLLVGLLFAAIGVYFFAMYFSTISMMETMCAGKASSIQVVRDYQVIALDFYMLGNLYNDNYMCSALCPCIPYAALDPAKWGNNA